MTTRHAKNPFMESVVVPVKGKRVQVSVLGGDNNVLVNQVTGEVHGTHVTTYKKVDSEQFVKLFTSNIALAFELSAAGIKAFTVLMWAIQNRALSKDEVDLDTFTLEDFLKEHEDKEPPLKLSLGTFRRGIAEMEKAQIVAKTLRQGRYFINPSFVFNGDRVAFTTMIERQEKDKVSG